MKNIKAMKKMLVKRIKKSKPTHLAPSMTGAEEPSK
jgi:hypothetical protein